MTTAVAASPQSPPRSGSALSTLASVGRLHIVAIAVAGCFTFGWAFTGVYPWLAAGVCGLDWFLVNILNRVVDVPEDRVNQIRDTSLVERWRRGILVAGLGTLVGSLVVLHLLAPALTPLRLCYHALGLGYNWPLLPGRRRIKNLYLLKNVASAAGFQLTVIGYPLALLGWQAALLADVPVAGVVACAGFFFLFELGYEVIYDLRDAAGDRVAGARTFPVVHGQRVAVWIIDALHLAALAVLVGGWAGGVVPWRLVVFSLAPALQLFLYKRALRRGLTSADCTGLTWLGAALLAAYHLWQLAGLPGAVPLP